jgi:hypothetical protein
MTRIGARIAPPRSGAMLEALRGLGYSTASALADIIDNSISAGAAEVRIEFAWDGASSRISVLDDGRGMDDAQLQRAMTLGDRDPRDARHPDDLGRFGMGLKTASFSQCRRLTVASRARGQSCCLRWDLDALAAEANGDWLLFEGPAAGSERFLSPLSDRQAGTLVLWEQLDRIVTRGYGSDDFNDLIDRVERHLSMVFHRFIGGARPRLSILVNGRAIRPWDPFMSWHAGKPWSSPTARAGEDGSGALIECHVLPHRDKLSEREFNEGAGPEGWNSQQGFYIYRNERLLLAGGWLGLGPGRAWNREEPYRLARIRLDIPNSADAAWKIDIRKSTARPPVALRPWLTRFAEDTRERARRVFAFRGAPAPRLGAPAVEQAWRVEHSASGVRYRIDETHPAVAAALGAAPQSAELIRAMLRVVEQTVPVQRIWLDTAEGKETPRTGFAGEPPEAVMQALNALYADMLGRRAMSEESAKRALLSAAPFNNFPALIAALPPSPASQPEEPIR